MRLAEKRYARRLISLTPLIDVVFILLLFFMLSTQFTQQKAMALSVPSDDGSDVIDDDGYLSLRLSAGGGVVIANGETATVESLTTHAAIRSAIDRNKIIRLDADDAVSLQLLVSVTDRLQRAGAGSVQLTALRQP